MMRCGCAWAARPWCENGTHTTAKPCHCQQQQGILEREALHALGCAALGQRHNTDNLPLHGATRTGGAGLYFYQSRWYDPSLSRFIQADTLIPDPYNSQSFDRYAYSYGIPVKYIDPTGHRTCSNEQAATGDETCDQNITDNDGPVIHKIFMGSFYASAPNQSKDQLPESNPLPITNPLVWISEFIGLIEDLIRPQIPEDNVSLWLTYSEYENGDVDDFYILVNNQSDQNVYLSRVAFSTKRWDEGFATNLACCAECGVFYARSTINDYLATIGPQSSTDINLSTYPSNPTISITPDYGFPPFSGNVSVQVTAYMYANTTFGLWNIQTSAQIYAPRP